MQQIDTLKSGNYMTKYIYSDINLERLTVGQQRTVKTLLKGKTYQDTANTLGVSTGTVYRQLKRVKDKHPNLYQEVMTVRKQQLAQRHKEALKRAEAHSRRYFRKKYNYEYMLKHGYYPWERWMYQPRAKQKNKESSESLRNSRNRDPVP
jgi:transposase